MHLLPPHGKIDCHDCFSDGQLQTSPHPKWLIRNDPGAWGSEKPKILILGFSKGATQTDIYQNGSFDDIAFGGTQTRRNLTKILQRVQLLTLSETVDEKIRKTEKKFAFGSLIRCSLSRLDKNNSLKTSGPLIIKSFSEIPGVISQCTRNFLSSLPDSVEIICFLGVADPYIKNCRKIIKKIYPHNFSIINDVCYKTDDFTCIHLTHPSKGNGTIGAWLEADPNNSSTPKRQITSAKKRELAIEGLRHNG
jgi:hypothetical protein